MSHDFKMPDLDKYIDQYSDSALWDKIRKTVGKVGKKVLYQALLLYLALKSDKVPMKIKASAMGALAYFISPIDLIPDVIPVAGFVDDAAVLSIVVTLVMANIDGEMRKEAAHILKESFGVDYAS